MVIGDGVVMMVVALDQNRSWGGGVGGCSVGGVVGGAGVGGGGKG